MFSKWFNSKDKAPANTPATPSPPAAEVKSPCNGVCDMDWQNNICVGCFRTPGEIGRWRSMTEDEKRDVVASAEIRAQEASA